MILKFNDIDQCVELDRLFRFNGYRFYMDDDCVRFNVKLGRGRFRIPRYDFYLELLWGGDENRVRCQFGFDRVIDLTI